MSRDRDNKTLQEKLRQLFKFNKTNPANIVHNREVTLTSDFLKELSKDSPTSNRVRMMKLVGESVVGSKLEQNGVEKLWSCVQDMFLKEYPMDVRHATFQFLQCLIKGQYKRIDIMRAKFFRFIKCHDNEQDLAQRVDLLATLTNNGKDVEHFEEEIGPFLLNWINDVNKVGKLQEYLTVVDNVIKFNSTHLDEIIMSGYVKHLCDLCCHSNQYAVVVLCLQILGTILAYSILPAESLPQFVGTLCRTVVVKCYSQASWKTMKNLLGTHLGHSTIFTMCRFLQEPSLANDDGLLQGCVFYMHMALWDLNSMQNLRCPHSAVLPSILQAVKTRHASVGYEVILGVQKLVKKHGLELLEPAWDIVLEILLLIAKQIETAPNIVPNNSTQVQLHEVLNSIENLIEVGSYRGSLKQYFGVVHECSRDRPETSVLKLVNFLAKSIKPTEKSWLQNLYNLLENYFKADTPTAVRLRVLHVLEDVLETYGQYDDEITTRIVLPHMQHVVNEDNVTVRTAICKFLVRLAMDCNNAICIDVLELLEKLIMRPFDKSELQSADASDLADIHILATGLVQLFHKKIHKLPSTHALLIYKTMVKWLERYHQQKTVSRHHNNQSRLAMFDCLLSMRADSFCRLGLPTAPSDVTFDIAKLSSNTTIVYSTYLCVTYKSSETLGGGIGSPPPTPTSSQLPVCKITHMAMEYAFKLFLLYLEKEKDWEVLKLILAKLPAMLENKAIVLSRCGNTDLNNLVNILCQMLQNRTLPLPDTANTKVSRLEFQTAIVTVMVSLSSYSNNNLDQSHQQMLINTLSKSSGTDPRCSRQSINALTICMVDMRETMMKLLPDVLLKLSKISATNNIAMPILEFLSTLSQLPTVYSNFVGDQYMAVFAIALPYTNPFKYDNYVVSLAYHVIAVWFLKCRLPFRKDFVKFIVSGLQTNVMVPFQDLNSFKYTGPNLSALNQDSSDRKRSSSLTEQGSRRRVKAADTKNKAGFMSQKPERDQTVLTFYEELNETCIDLMARYTYSPCSALPTRMPTADFLLNGGLSKSWMLGNKLITITTSGCTEKVLKHGVCDKCWSACCPRDDGARLARQQRSNSGPDERDLTRQSSDESKKETSAATIKLLSVNDDLKSPPLCSCWCQGWAEILIRRPTGNVSWMMKIQNQVAFKQLIFEFPLNEMSTLYMPDLHREVAGAGGGGANHSIEEEEKGGGGGEEAIGGVDGGVGAVGGVSRPGSVPGSPSKPSLSRQSSHESASAICNVINPMNPTTTPGGAAVPEDLEDAEEFYYDDPTGKSRNPVRRSNSSPEMANWKNPFIVQHQKNDASNSGNSTILRSSHHHESQDSEEDFNKKTPNKKDVRVSCEAIPEEISGLGTSPPSGQTLQSSMQSDSCQRVLKSDSCQPQQHHPSLLTCHSYPGSSPPSSECSKPYKTVPPSPNQTLNQQPPHFHDNDANLERPTHLPNLTNLALAPLAAKPPQSPTQTSPRLQRHHSEIQKSSSSSKLEKNRAKSSIESILGDKRDRLHTVSVMSTSQSGRKPQPKVPKEILKSGLNPSFVFLQLFHSSVFGNTNETPLYVHPTPVIERAITILDRMYPYELHKIGVLYINEGQVDREADILKNSYGSIRYLEFLQNLGTLVRLSDVKPCNIYLGGVDASGADGKYLYTHQDDLVMLAFHVGTLMPNKEQDVHCNNKKKHIGNDNVVIVYNNSGEEFDISTFKSQVTLAYIIVEPLDYNCNRVVVKVKSDLLKIIGSNETIIVSDQSVSILVRQLAIHADLAATVLNSLRSHATDPYVSNWLERLRKLKNLRQKVIQEIKKTKDLQKGYSEEKDAVEDFTDFT